MKTKSINIGNLKIGGNRPFVLFAGPCVIESARTTFEHARKLKEITSKLNVPFVFKCSYDKANRTSLKSFRGPGLVEGLKVLQDIKQKLCVPVMSDVHTQEEIEIAGSVLDVMQIPAFLCRQTDLIHAAASSAKVVNIKKGQFLAPWDMENVIKKASHSGAKNIMVTERGVSFGYNNLVSDMRSLAILRDLFVLS